MTPITLPVAELKPALTGLGKVVAKRAALPVSTTIRIDRDTDGGLRLSATDLDAFLTVRLSDKEVANPVGIPGTLLVPFTALNNVTKTCRVGDRLEISPDSKDYVSIRYPIGSQSASRRVESYPANDWPQIPEVDGDTIPVPKDLRLSLLEALQCATTDETRHVLRGACIDVSDKKCNYVVGTDGHHLYASNSFCLPLAESVIIPEHKFLAWRGFAEDGDWTMRVGKDTSWLVMESGHWTFTVKPIAGTYPNWRQVLPGEEANKSSVTFPEDIAPVIEAVQKLPDPDKINHGIGVRLANGKQTLVGPNAGEENAVAFPNASIKGGPVTIYLNRQFLIKALRFGLRELQISDPLSPMRFAAECRQMIVMPVRVNGYEQSSPPAVEPAGATEAPKESPKEKSMPENNGHEAQRIIAAEAGSEKPALDFALAQIEIVRGGLRDTLCELNKLGDLLKQASREKKTSEKDVQSVRATLEKLQSVRI